MQRLPQHGNDSLLRMLHTPRLWNVWRNERRLNHADNQRSPILVIVVHPDHLLPVGLRGHSQTNRPTGVLAPSPLPSNQARRPRRRLPTNS